MGEREVITQTSVPRIRESLAADLKELGLGEGATVIVHTSLSSFGYVVGGAETVIQALMGCADSLRDSGDADPISSTVGAFILGKPAGA